jgi:NAD(P)H-flavin reductase
MKHKIYCGNGREFVIREREVGFTTRVIRNSSERDGLRIWLGLMAFFDLELMETRAQTELVVAVKSGLRSENCRRHG